MNVAWLAGLLVLSAPEKERLVVIDIASTDAAARKVSAQMSELVLTEAARFERFRVLGQSDIAVMLGLERQRQLLGCSDDATSCMAEIGGALNATWILTGALGRVGKRYRIDLKLIDSRQNVVQGRVGQTLGAAEDVLDALPDMVRELLGALPPPAVAPEVKPESPPAAAPPAVAQPVRSPPFPWGPLAVGAVGVAGLATGVALVASAKGDEAGWDAYLSTHPLAEAEAYRSAAQAKGIVGPLLLGVGGVAVAGALLWYVLAPKSAPAVALVVSPSGAGLRVGGTW
ncbi:MAG: hypothetical protein AB1730_07335 [Myxococcota bacterium]|jgi:TolB-like protein